MAQLPNPATPGQIEYGTRMENRYEIEPVFDWTKVTRNEARERNGMLRSLHESIRDEHLTVLRDYAGYLQWDWSDEARGSTLSQWEPTSE